MVAPGERIELPAKCFTPSGKGDDQVYRQNEQIAHELQVITLANLHKNCAVRAIHAKIYEFATHTAKWTKEQRQALEQRLSEMLEH